MPPFVVWSLIALAVIVMCLVIAAVGIRLFGAHLARTGPGARALMFIARQGARLARSQARRRGEHIDEMGMPLSDAELLLSRYGGSEGEELRRMIGSLPAAQRGRVRAMMNNIDMGDLMEASAAGAEAGDGGYEREARRLIGQVNTSEPRPLTPAQAKAKRRARAARKRRR